MWPGQASDEYSSFPHVKRTLMWRCFSCTARDDELFPTNAFLAFPETILGKWQAITTVDLKYCIFVNGCK